MDARPDAATVDRRLHPMLPAPARVRRRRRETPGVWTLELDPPEGFGAVAPGQFNMLYAFGVGEVAISVSGAPGEGRGIAHTIRAVGAVTRALVAAAPGTALGLRGPFGAGWPLDAARGGDVVVVAGGVGLAPLRQALLHLLENRAQHGRIVLLYGARSPDDILFRREIEGWRRRLDLAVEVTVDHAGGDWRGHVGVVPSLIARAEFDPARAAAFVCGPEVMMRYAIAALRHRGVADAAIHLSMERNMACAIGHCGRCQFGPAFICKDGPVLRYDLVRDLLTREGI